MIKDLVCGMGVEEDEPDTFSKSFQGKQYYFCSPECLSLFVQHPFDYINVKQKNVTMAKDLVCGMDADATNPPFLSIYNRERFYFCSNMCKMEFDRNPEVFKRKSQE